MDTNIFKPKPFFSNKETKIINQREKGKERHQMLPPRDICLVLLSVHHLIPSPKMRYDLTSVQSNLIHGSMNNNKPNNNTEFIVYS